MNNSIILVSVNNNREATRLRHAWLNRMDAEEEPLFIARALLPEEIDEGTTLKYAMLLYVII